MSAVHGSGAGRTEWNEGTPERSLDEAVTERSASANVSRQGATPVIGGDVASSLLADKLRRTESAEGRAPVGGGGLVTSPFVAKQLDKISERSPEIASITGKLHDAMVRGSIAARGSDVTDWSFQHQWITRYVADTVGTGHVSGYLRAALRSMASSEDGWTGEVKTLAAELAKALDKTVDPNRLSIDFSKSGEKRADIDVRVDGESRRGTFVAGFDAEDKQIARPHIEIDGEKYLVEDGALNEIVGRAGGVGTDWENSDQTKYIKSIRSGLLGFLDGIPSGYKGIVSTQEGGEFKVLTHEDSQKRGAIYYHDGYVQLDGID